MIAVVTASERQYLDWCLRHSFVNRQDVLRARTLEDVAGVYLDGIVLLDPMCSVELYQALLIRMPIL